MNDKTIVLNLELCHLEPLQGKNPEIVLQKGCELLSSLNAHYFISNGTLLGLYRDSNFIPDDTDIDVDCIFVSNDQCYDIFHTFKRNGFTPIRIVIHDNKFCQLAFVEPEQRIVFDICFYHQIGDNLVMWTENIQLTTRKEIILPITDNKPAQIEHYLVWRYGFNWHIPTPGDKGIYT